MELFLILKVFISVRGLKLTLGISNEIIQSKKLTTKKIVLTRNTVERS